MNSIMNKTYHISLAKIYNIPFVVLVIPECYHVIYDTASRIKTRNSTGAIKLIGCKIIARQVKSFALSDR